MRNQFHPIATLNPTIDGLLGEAYKNVALVASKMAELEEIIANISFFETVHAEVPLIEGLGAHIPEIEAIDAAIPDIQAVLAGLTDIQTVLGDIPQITAVRNALNEVVEVYDKLAEIQVIEGKIAEIETVSALDTEIVYLHSIKDKLEALYGLHHALDQLNAIRDNINIVATYILDVIKASANMDSIQRLNALATQIQSLGSLSTQIENLGNLHAELQALYAARTWLHELYTARTTMEDIHYRLQELVEVHADLPELLDIHAIKDRLMDIQSRLDEIVDIHNVYIVSGIAAEVTTVAGDSVAIQGLYSQILVLQSLYAKLTELLNLNSLETQLLALYAIRVELEALGQNIPIFSSIHQYLPTFHDLDQNKQTLIDAANVLNVAAQLAGHIAEIDRLYLSHCELIRIHDSIDNVDTVAGDTAEINYIATYGIAGYTNDTNTVELSGSALNGDPLEADVKLSQDGGNLIEARVDGLYYGIQAPADISTLYVSTSAGDDTNDGTISNPLKTLREAFDRQVNSPAEYTIRLKAGETFKLFDGIINRPLASYHIETYGDSVYGGPENDYNMGGVPCTNYRPYLGQEYDRATIVFGTRKVQNEPNAAEVELATQVAAAKFVIQGIKLRTERTYSHLVWPPAAFTPIFQGPASYIGCDINLNPGDPGHTYNHPCITDQFPVTLRATHIRSGHFDDGGCLASILRGKPSLIASNINSIPSGCGEHEPYTDQVNNVSSYSVAQLICVPDWDPVTGVTFNFNVNWDPR